MNTNMIKYRIEKVIKNALIFVVIYTILYGAVWMFMGDVSVEMFEQIVMVIPMIEEFPQNEMEQYQTFGYSRKGMFRYCLMGEAIRALIYGGIFRTVIQILFYAEYVKDYTEFEPETISQYHQCPVWELFLVNFAIIFFMRLLLVLDGTRKYPLYFFRNLGKKKKKAGMSRWRKAVWVMELIIGFIVFFAVIVVIVGSYDWMLRNTMQDKMGMYLAALAGLAILVGVTRWRFLPKQKRVVRERQTA